MVRSCALRITACQAPDVVLHGLGGRASKLAWAILCQALRRKLLFPHPYQDGRIVAFTGSESTEAPEAPAWSAHRVWASSSWWPVSFAAKRQRRTATASAVLGERPSAPDVALEVAPSPQSGVASVASEVGPPCPLPRPLRELQPCHLRTQSRTTSLKSSASRAANGRLSRLCLRERPQREPRLQR